MSTVSPQTVALISASLTEAMHFGLQMSELLKRTGSGEVTDEEARAIWRDASAAYSAGRTAWDQAGEDAE